MKNGIDKMTSMAMDWTEEELQNLGINADDFEEQQTSFPPYWKPEVGKIFFATPVHVQTREGFDGKPMVSYIMRAEAPVECLKGSKDNVEKVMVGKGSLFTVPEFYTLPLRHCMDITVAVKVIKAPEQDGLKKTPWMFLLKTPKAAHSTIQQRIISEGRQAAQKNLLPAASSDGDETTSF